ncbi:MAG: single-stranded DNA-binding protein [Phycisphaerae bacterium]|nr:single-stranded DNA-binding protein [Phycisphaerae bacterium]
MANYNKVLLIGNLTRDPQLTYLPSQTPVTEIGLAVNRRWRGQDGEQREETCFVDCKAFGRQAEVLNQYMSKGRPLFIEGRLQLDTWEGKDGQKRSKHRVVIERFQFLGGGPGGDGGQGGSGRSRPAQQAPSGGNAGPPAPSYDDEQGPGDDIPF